MRARYARTTIDLGTGDGRVVCARAADDATCFAIGIDAAREPLRTASRKAPANALFIIANVAALPRALNGIASAVTIFFPHGSLLELLCGEGCGMETVAAVMLPGATLGVLLNAGAFGDSGLAFDDGITRVLGALRRSRFRLLETVSLDASTLRCSPTTWGRRLAFGRDPRAISIRAWTEAGPDRGQAGAS